MNLRPRSKVGVALWLAGFAGVFSTLFIDLNGLLALLPPTPQTQDLVITPALKALSLLQPAILLTVAVAAGLFLAPAVGLSAPIVESAAHRAPGPRVMPVIVAGILGGVGGAAGIVIITAAFRPLIDPVAAARISEFLGLVPPATRVLYGGLTEEVLVRWGLMTTLVWLGWKLFQRNRPAPGASCFGVAILISAVLFALGHLPVALLVVPNSSGSIVAFVILSNSLFGLIAGWLYWKRGLESAMIAHVTTHVLLLVAARLGFYFG